MSWIWRWIATALVCATVMGAKRPDVGRNAAEIAKWAVRNFQKDQLASLGYEYTVTDEKPKSAEMFRVATLFGTPYERLTGKDGMPLSDSDEKREQAKYDKAVFNRKKELKGQHDNRVRAWKEGTRYLEEAPDAFTCKLGADEEVDGRAAFVLACAPNPGFAPREDRAKMFRAMTAKAWVDKEELRIVKIEAETTEAVATGWVLFGWTQRSIGKGTHFSMEQMRLGAEMWQLKRLSVEGSERVANVQNRQLSETLTYSDYRLVGKPIK